MGKGQISVELLLVFFVFLGLLAIAYSATRSITASVGEKADASLAASSIGDLRSKILSACSFGEGNVRIFTVAGRRQISVSESDGGMTATVGGVSEEIGSDCEISVQAAGAASSLRIENSGGRIIIS